MPFRRGGCFCIKEVEVLWSGFSRKQKRPQKRGFCLHLNPSYRLSLLTRHFLFGVRADLFLFVKEKGMT